MALEPGTRLGVYEITAAIGAGGMGAVYRARDTRLERDVAIKVVLESLVEDADRAERFQREARALAALNHPNIATLHGLEAVDGQHFLVMELVEGKDLSEIISEGARGMPLEDAIPIARQIAEALEAAHEAGIIHRDLKPANVKVKANGTVKVLDFGLAKAISPGSEDPGLQPDAANSPTLTARATQMGMIMGTAAYMAPEQAKGMPVDKRADVWAFGVVLFEMLTGQRPFDGSDVSEVMARVISHEPNWNLLPTDLPVALRRLLRRALVRARTDRLPDIAAARLEIADVEAGVTDIDTAGAPDVASAPPAIWQRPAFLVMAAMLLIAVTAIVASTFTGELTPSSDTVSARFQHVLPEGQAFSGSGRRTVALSPDGTQLVYTADGRLYLRDLGTLEAQPITGTQVTPREPTFSPDGLWIAFHENDSGPGAIRKVPVGGGTSSLVTTAGLPIGVSWASGFIVYGQLDGIYRVADIGGTPERLVSSDPLTGLRLGHLQLVDAGRFLLYSASDESEPRPVVADPTVTSLNGELSPDGRWIVYESSESGDAEVFVRPFPEVDAGRWQVSSGGGTRPARSRSGRELFYVGDTGSDQMLTVVAVPVLAPDAPFDFGDPQSLFPYLGPSSRVGRMYDVSPDGQRFVCVVPDTNAAAGPAAITIITDWFTTVRQVR